MAERTLVADSEKAEGIAADKTQEADAILVETPVVTEDGSKIKSRVKRNIITVPERTGEIEKNGTRYRRDANGRWRPVLYWLTFHTIRRYELCHPTNVAVKYRNNISREIGRAIFPLCIIEETNYFIINAIINVHYLFTVLVSLITQ